jgi:ACS family glucarate transporter-like MFS transporter
MQLKIAEKRTNVRWIIGLFMFAALAINYLDRAVMSAAAPAIMHDLHINAEEMGIIMSAFFWSYALFQIPAGWLADKIGQRLTLAGAVIWWSVATAVTALAKTTGGLIGARIFMGLGEAGAYPCNAGVSAKWFPNKERGRVTALFDSGSKVGTAFSMPIVALIVATFGWRLAFVMCGAIGLLWAIAWVMYYRDPEKHRYANQAELAYIKEGQTKISAADKAHHATIKWTHLLGHRTVIMMCLGYFMLNYALYFFITWFPTYLIKERGMALMTMGYMAMLPPLCGVFAQYLGGFLTDYLYIKTGSLSLARKATLVTGMLFATLISLAGYAESNYTLIALLCVAYSGLAFATSAIWCLPGDLAPKHMVSVLSGIQSCIGNCGGIFSPLITGYIIATTHSCTSALLISGGGCAVGALVYLFCPIKPLELNKKKKTSA